MVRDHRRPAAVRGARALSAAGYSERTAWARSLQTPLREFLRTETGGAAVLLAATAAALLWVNVDAGSYDDLWSTRLSIDLGGSGVALDLRGWVNSGLMTFFFFVVGDNELNYTRCAACGSLLFSVVRDGEWVHVALGSLVDEPSIRPTEHIFVGSKAPWFEITDDLPQYAELPD